ncbi:hypothetical protein [Streptomyces sp. NPDC048248]|uniref:hypothetical protein n=1 Tax=Streptomyces sp. NPDC048248 TaxID=3365523 RepID=UPI0037113408
MSRSELERLARIRMQVTGESLERALAALMGQTAGSDPETEDDAPQSEDVPQHEDTARLEDVSLCEDVQTPAEDVRKPAEDIPAPAQEQDQDRPTPGGGRKRPSRSHLRGL